MPINVTVWNEGRHEKNDTEIGKVYPDGLHGAIKKLLETDGDFLITTTTLDDPCSGLPDELLEKTNVLIWWGHMSHEDVPMELALKVQNRVLRGMGFIALHSAHMSRPFRLLMGTSCTLKWRDGCRERLWVTDPSHPIAKGLPETFELKTEEMYGEFFDIPKPESVVFTGWFNTGNVFRSGCCWTRGAGRVFYFQPGHETNPTFKLPEVGLILKNAVHWAYRVNILPSIDCEQVTSPLEG
ncbi:MAG: ThuA domain-containing protein [Eubacteriales bacterium]|nr:ThuA domain-containing protein [Eubacteriales bacterium]MDD3881512.1 ThuA domain-containing protein [Eubacteriales bacterium]MDD4513006.1 ThuA domain-containing protein [Eubacteriales bacterium]